MTMFRRARAAAPADHPWPAEPLRVALASDAGLAREENQDAASTFSVASGPGVDDMRIVMVLDGMGGRAGGSVASELAASVLTDELRCVAWTEVFSDRDWQRKANSAIQTAFDQANGAIRTRARDDATLAGMGTTAALLLIAADWCGTAWIGDTRVYRLRDDTLERLTSDHSIGEEALLYDAATPDSQLANDTRLTRGLGPFHRATASILWTRCERRDLYLACTDGLTTYLDGEALRRALLPVGRLDEAAQRLITDANAAGGHDNITVALVQVVELRRPPLPTPRPATEPLLLRDRRWLAEQPPTTAPTSHRTARAVAYTVALLACLAVAARFATRPTTHRPPVAHANPQQR
jgi:PPM family protein phosphatase